MITTADINLGTRFGGEVDIPFDVKLVTNDLQSALGRIRGTALIDTTHTVHVDDETHWYYRFVVDGTNQRVTLERLRVPDGADSMAYTDRETIDVEDVSQGRFVGAYERTLAHLVRHTQIGDDGGLTTTHGDEILTAVFDRYGEYPDSEIAQTEAISFASFEAIEKHFTQNTVRRLWRGLTHIDGVGADRATNLIVGSNATELSDLRDELDTDDWEHIQSTFDGADESN